MRPRNNPCQRVANYIGSFFNSAENEENSLGRRLLNISQYVTRYLPNANDMGGFLFEGERLPDDLEQARLLRAIVNLTTLSFILEKLDLNNSVESLKFLAEVLGRTVAFNAAIEHIVVPVQERLMRNRM
jgi:hypothetical protein